MRRKTPGRSPTLPAPADEDLVKDRHPGDGVRRRPPGAVGFGGALHRRWDTVHREDEKGLVTTDPIGVGRMAGAIVLPVLLIAVIVTGAAGVYFLVDRWESRPIQ